MTKDSSSLKSFISGGFGGTCLVLAGHPLDLIKVKLQTSTQYSSTLQCFKGILKESGVRGLYRGMFTPLVGVTPIFATCFWGYDIGQKLSIKIMKKTSDGNLSMKQICFAGGFSALPSTLLMTPIERVKCILQTNKALSGPSDSIKLILKEDGAIGFYRGFFATLLRDCPGSVAYFGSYEFFKKLFSSKDPTSTNLSPIAVLCAGGLAGMCNWAVAIPPDVIKSRLQTAPKGTYNGIADVFVKLIKTEGISALFRGLGPAMIRAFPANAACFLGVELSLNAMNKIF